MKMIILSLLISYISANCKFTHSGKNYDLTALESKAPFTSSDSLYSMGLCKKDTASCSLSSKKDFMVQFFDPSKTSTQCLAILASWDDDFKPTVGPVTVSLGLCSKSGKDCSIATKKTFLVQYFKAGQKSTDCLSVLAYWDTDSAYTVGGLSGTDANKDGFSLKFSNGQYCDLIGRQRELTANFVCDPKQEAGSYEVEESPVCIYSLTMHTKHACESHGGGSSGTTEDSGLSGGWVFIIILIVATFCYCVGGIVYNCKFNDQAGDEIKEMMPQKEFWCEKLPGWTYTGCVVSWDWAQSQYHERFGGDKYVTELGEA